MLKQSWACLGYLCAPIMETPFAELLRLSRTQHRRRNARGTSAVSAWRMIAIRSGRREATGHFLVPSCNLPTVFPAGLAGKILCKKCLILLEQKGRSNAAYAVPPKRTSELSRAMSALCHKRTRAGQQTIRRIRRELRRFPWQARRD